MSTIFLFSKKIRNKIEISIIAYKGRAIRHILKTSGGARIAPIIMEDKKVIFLFFDMSDDFKMPDNPSRVIMTGTSKIIPKIKTITVNVLK